MPDKAQSRRNKLLDHEALWNYALRLLGARGYSEKELRGKLRSRAARPRDLEPVIGRLREYGYLDDRRLAASYAAARLENQGFGRERVLRDLRRKGVASGLARDAVQETYRDTDEAALIEAFLARKFRGVSLREHLAEPRHLAAAYRRLRNAGFGPAASIAVLRGYSERADELEHLEPETDP